jgi:hypothetical protein
MDGHAVTGLHARHGRTHRDDFSRELVTGNQRFADYKIANSAMCMVMQIGSTDAASSDAHLNIVIANRRRIYFF